MRVQPRHGKPFELHDASHLEKLYDDCAPIIETDCHKFAQQLNRLLWNELQWHTSIRAQKAEPCCYVLVLYAPKIRRAKPAAERVKAARALARALAIGIDTTHLYAVA